MIAVFVLYIDQTKAFNYFRDTDTAVKTVLDDFLREGELKTPCHRHLMLQGCLGCCCVRQSTACGDVWHLFMFDGTVIYINQASIACSCNDTISYAERHPAPPVFIACAPTFSVL